MRSLSLFALCFVTLAGCQMTDAMDDVAAMKNSTNDLKANTNELDTHTLELKRLSIVADGKSQLVAPENTRSYAPPSVNLVVAAKEVAENMQAGELMEFIDGKIKELMESRPKESEYDSKLLGGYSPQYAAEFNLQQQVRIVALQAIAGHIPQAMLEQLIKQQTDCQKNCYVDSLYSTLMLRAMYIDSFDLDKGIFDTASPWESIGEVRDATAKVSQLDFVASLPFGNRINFVVPNTSFLPVVNAPELHAVPVTDAASRAAQNNYLAKCQPVSGDADFGCYATLGDAPSYAVQLDPDMAKHWWKKISQNINKLPDSVKSANAAELAILFDQAKRNSAH